MNWYYANGQESIGPLDAAAFQAAVARGDVTDETLVWREGMADWLPYGAVGQASRAAVQRYDGQERCTACGNYFPVAELLPFNDLYVCAACKPVFFQRLQEGGSLPAGVRIAPMGRRVAAKLLDVLIGMVVQYGISIPILLAQGLPLTALVFPESAAEVGTMYGMSAFSFVFQIFYVTWFVGKYGATPGKMALGLRIVRGDGGALTYGRAFGRFWGEYLSSIPCGLGYFMAFFDTKERRALHDRICDTRVVAAR